MRVAIEIDDIIYEYLVVQDSSSCKDACDVYKNKEMCIDRKGLCAKVDDLLNIRGQWRVAND